MPKTVVVLPGSSDDNVAPASAVAEGVKSARFAEVEIRRIDDDGLELATFDAIVLSVGAGEGGLSHESRQLIERLVQAGSSNALLNKVGSAVVTGVSGDAAVTASWAAMAAMGQLGMILVAPSQAQDADSAKELGKRVAEVTAWVTHAKSHQHH